MIYIVDNQLHFNFTSIADRVELLVKQKIQATLEHLVSEDRLASVDQLFKTHHAYRNASTVTRQRAASKVLALSPEAIRDAIINCIYPYSYVGRGGKMNVGGGISFMRTLRIPDDGKTYPLPPGLGRFSLRRVDDYCRRVPQQWLSQGGVMLPIYQAEALWLNFAGDYPIALRVATGKIDSVTGKAWRPGLNQDPQNYLILPEQPWLDGYCVEKGFIRQFVAMPLGKGYTVEEQITGTAEYGGLQLEAYPLKAEVHFRESIEGRFPQSLVQLLPRLVPPEPDHRLSESRAAMDCYCAAPEMGLGAGGRMQQEIYEDWRELEDWNQELRCGCFVHFCNSQMWSRITGGKPPHRPITAKAYSDYGLPWFDYYREDLGTLPGSKVLNQIRTVNEIAREEGDDVSDDDEPVSPSIVIQYGQKRRPDEVREWLDDYC
ncbi:MAG: hypothetical protein JO025_25265 [Verrucomicrobia bacterium]|nr:hypothetical protein [Verrucomicrobiota bacterium]